MFSFHFPLSDPAIFSLLSFYCSFYCPSVSRWTKKKKVKLQCCFPVNKTMIKRVIEKAMYVEAEVRKKRRKSKTQIVRTRRFQSFKIPIFGNPVIKPRQILAVLYVTAIYKTQEYRQVHIASLHERPLI